jgi:hypothetical protein
LETPENEGEAEMDDKTRTELEAAAFRTLLGHLQKRKDVQNIDLMNLAGFCRNCLSKWYVAAAKERGLEVSMEDARAYVYGMPYDEWRAKYQTEASAEQQETFKKVMADPELTT